MNFILENNLKSIIKVIFCIAKNNIVDSLILIINSDYNIL